MAKKQWFFRSLVLMVSFFLVAAVMVTVASLGEFRTVCEEIPGRVLRLHVLANSDSEEDQSLKLLVRDAILRENGSLFSGAGDKAEALALVQKHSDVLTETARKTLLEQGCLDDVTVSLEETFFPTRTYGNVTLPAGVYDAVRVKIGAAEGQNWWCVLFPSLCIPSAVPAQMDETLTGEQLKVVETSGYDVRFQVVEWYERAVNWLR